MQLYREQAAEYQMFRRDQETEQPLQLVENPILTYTNPVRVRDTHGGAFLWTHDGRPEVVGAIWSVVSPKDSTKRHLSHEFHSLSTVPVFSQHSPRQSDRGIVPDWNCNQPGVEPQRIANAPTPVQSEQLRLVQMRQLAKQFKAKIPSGIADGQGSLRLLAQPVYRYRSETHRVIDGAVFAFVMGTDPELILMIEAVQSDGKAEWKFAAAPLTNIPLSLDFQDTEVWKCPRAIPYVADQPHFLYWAISIRDRELQ